LSKLYPIFKGNKSSDEQNINESDFIKLLESTEYENGLVIMMEMHKAFIPAYEGIQRRSEQIIKMINNELEK
jgi:hypothetical protein